MGLLNRNNKIYKRLSPEEMLIFDLETKESVLRLYEETRQGYSKTYYIEVGLDDLDKKDSLELDQINLIKQFEKEVKENQL